MFTKNVFNMKIKTSAEIKEEINVIKKSIQNNFSDEDINRYQTLKRQLKKSLRSEYFKNNILNELLKKGNIINCDERGVESFYIDLVNGRKYVYYPTKNKLKEFRKGGRNVTIYLAIQDFLYYIDFLVENPERIDVAEFYMEVKKEYIIEEELQSYRSKMGYEKYRSISIEIDDIVI